MTQRHRIDELSFALLELVRGRNRSLESLVRAAESFLREAAHPPADPRDDDHFQRTLDVYSGRRDQGIRSYVLFDKHASETASRIGELRASGRNPDSPRYDIQSQVKSAIESEVERTTTLMSLNADLDAQVVARIEAEKERVVVEVRKAGRSRDRLSRFRSEWVPPTGDEVDQKL